MPANQIISDGPAPSAEYRSLRPFPSPLGHGDIVVAQSRRSCRRPPGFNDVCAGVPSLGLGEARARRAQRLLGRRRSPRRWRNRAGSTRPGGQRRRSLHGSAAVALAPVASGEIGVVPHGATISRTARCGQVHTLLIVDDHAAVRASVRPGRARARRTRAGAPDRAVIRMLVRGTRRASWPIR
jgi:hypothetical protein